MNELSNEHSQLAGGVKPCLFRRHRMLINGRFTGAQGDGALAVVDATNLQQVGLVPAATVADVDAAARALLKSLEGPFLLDCDA